MSEENSSPIEKAPPAPLEYSSVGMMRKSFVLPFLGGLFCVAAIAVVVGVVYRILDWLVPRSVPLDILFCAGCLLAAIVAGVLLVMRGLLRKRIPPFKLGVLTGLVLLGFPGGLLFAVGALLEGVAIR